MITMLPGLGWAEQAHPRLSIQMGDEAVGPASVSYLIALLD